MSTTVHLPRHNDDDERQHPRPSLLPQRRVNMRPPTLGTTYEDWGHQDEWSTRDRGARKGTGARDVSCLELQVSFFLFFLIYFTNTHYLQSLCVATTTIVPRNGKEGPTTRTGSERRGRGLKTRLVGPNDDNKGPNDGKPSFGP